MNKNYSIAIDGPASAGKSTVAKKVAEKLEFVYIDTGAMYRAIGLYCIKNDIPISDAKAVIKELPNINVSFSFEKGQQVIFLNSQDVNNQIRTEEISKAASDVSAIPEVREYLVGLQKKIAGDINIVMDGRDIGSVVLPNATLKIYLTATPEIRADRRTKELLEKGIKADYGNVLNDLNERDYNDSHRKASPLKVCEDAMIIESDNMTAGEVAKKIVELMKPRM